MQTAFTKIGLQLQRIGKILNCPKPFISDKDTLYCFERGNSKRVSILNPFEFQDSEFGKKCLKMFHYCEFALSNKINKWYGTYQTTQNLMSILILLKWALKNVLEKSKRQKKNCKLSLVFGFFSNVYWL